MVSERSSKEEFKSDSTIHEPKNMRFELTDPTLSPQSSQKKLSQHFVQNIVTNNEDKDIRDYYEIDQMPVLGIGITGQVKICVHIYTRIEYALKILDKKELKEDKIQKLRQEVSIMCTLDHPHILRYSTHLF